MFKKAIVAIAIKKYQKYASADLVLTLAEACSPAVPQ